jgi:hypothetical protein
MMLLYFLTLGLTLGLPIAAQSVPNPLDKIEFSLTAIDANGLIGAGSGKRSQAYEFCVPAGKKAPVQALDPSLQFSPSPGRVQCQPGELLAIGETHQPRWWPILLNLARLPYVKKIAPHWAE